MLAKSPKSAVILAGIFGGAAILIAVIAGQVRAFLTPPEARYPNAAGGFAGIVPLLTGLGVALVLLLVLALVIYRLDESHYDRRGALRWAIAGALYGLLQQVVLTSIPADFDFSALSILKQIGGDLLTKALTLVLVYFLVFPLQSIVVGRSRRLSGR